jgi:hypothetical protein
MGDTHVDEVADLGESSGVDSRLDRHQIDCAKLGALGRAWVSDTHQVDERAALRDMLPIACGVERVAYHDGTSGGRFAF